MMQTLYVIVQDHYDRIIKMRETFLLHAHYFQIVYAIYYYFFLLLDFQHLFLTPVTGQCFILLYNKTFWYMAYTAISIRQNSNMKGVGEIQAQ